MRGLKRSLSMSVSLSACMAFISLLLDMPAYVKKGWMRYAMICYLVK
jgi:hypothetical protein